MQPTIDARIAIDRDPLPLAKLRSFPVGRSRPTHQAWLTAGGSELILASSRRQWLFLWTADLERGTVGERVSLPAPDDLGNFSIGQDGDRLWVVGDEGVLGISRPDGRVLDWRSYRERLPPDPNIHETVLIPGSSYLWVNLGDSSHIFDLASDGMDCRRGPVGWARPLPTPGGPRVWVRDDRDDRDDRCRLYRPDGVAAGADVLEVEGGTALVTSAPDGRGFVYMVVVEHLDRDDCDLRLRWLAPRAGSGYRVAGEHEIRNVAEYDWFHRLVTSFDAGLCFVLSDYGGRKTLHALSLTAGGFRERYRLAVPYTSELIGDDEGSTAALLFGDEEGIRVLPLGPEPPERFLEALLEPPRAHYPKVGRRSSEIRFSDPANEDLWTALHRSGLVLLRAGRTAEAHAAFEKAARYEEASLDVEFLALLTEPMSDPPEAGEWGPDQPLLRRLLGAIRTADHARGAGDVAAALAALDRPWVWEESEEQSFARLAELVLERPASIPAERFDKRLVLAHYCHVRGRPERGLPREVIRLPGVSWEEGKLDRVEDRAEGWLEEEAGG